MVYFAKNSSTLDKFESYLQKHLTIKITETLTKYVGHELEVSTNKTRISVQGHIKACLGRFDWINIKERKYAGKKGFKIINPDSPILVDKSKFLSVLGCLNYVSSIARPDIAFTTNFLARNSSSPREDHMELAKPVFQYLKFSRDKGIDYCHLDKEKPLRITAFSDSDWAGDLITRKSTSGYIIYLENSPICWKCKKQGVLAMSSFEAELIPMCECLKELEYILEIMKWSKLYVAEPIYMFWDNQSGIKSFREEVVARKARHMELRYHLLKDRVLKETISICKVASEDNPADLLTKFHPIKVFENLLNIMLFRVRLKEEVIFLEKEGGVSRITQ